MSFAPPVRWGILGAANFALNHMGPAIHAARGAELVAVASSAAEKVTPFQAFAPGIRHEESYEALLAATDIDAVYIPLPNHLHVEWAEKALRAGKHVLCEKPLGMTSAEIEGLIRVRDDTGLVAAEAFMIVHHPQFQRARDLVADGAIGELRFVNAEFSYDNPDSKNIRNKPETGGGGLRDIGVYTFGATRFVTGAEPERMTHARKDLTNGVDTFSHNIFEFPGFTMSSMVSTRMAPRQGMHFHGTEGVLSLTTPFNANVFGQAEVHLSRPDLTVMTERFPGVNHYVLQVENFGAAIRGEAAYPWSLEQAQGTQRMIEAALEA
ncbi:Gfo/Idh/MocA family protein [Pseudooceanicola sp. HF7]|uniref:Gfo/Idh/MocA family protein n=1 Tax=Pseudooceanicola sp. HF7 TaxID=2721560 RepID=UPI001430DB1A|nr:Gfo/Idh/MocA family oxidoreductase [Pseudooceanicola sp. HF7]NIZ10201.1 Gfo/Idh/MocA family oxidoreductase [Pseudooceanicola sp. HF7]